MDSTQPMDPPSDAEDDDDYGNWNKKEQVFGHLRFTEDSSGDVKEFRVVGGENSIGRDPDSCSITIHDSKLSRVHAIIEVADENSITVHDNHSLNKSWRNGALMKPGIRYALEGGERLTFGDVTLTFELAVAPKREEPRTTGTASCGKGESVEFVPPSQSSPVSPRREDAEREFVLESPAIEEEPAEASSELNDSSFVAPSQPQALARTVVNERSSSKDVKPSIFDMETQAVVNIYDAETQQVNLTTESCESTLVQKEKEWPEKSRPRLSSTPKENQAAVSDKPKSMVNDSTLSSLGEKGGEVADAKDQDDPYSMPTQPVVEEDANNSDNESEGGESAVSEDLLADDDHDESVRVAAPEVREEAARSPLVTPRDDPEEENYDDLPTQLLSPSQDEAEANLDDAGRHSEDIAASSPQKDQPSPQCSVNDTPLRAKANGTSTLVEGSDSSNDVIESSQDSTLHRTNFASASMRLALSAGPEQTSQGAENGSPYLDDSGEAGPSRARRKFVRRSKSGNETGDSAKAIDVPQDEAVEEGDAEEATEEGGEPEKPPSERPETPETLELPSTQEIAESIKRHNSSELLRTGVVDGEDSPSEDEERLVIDESHSKSSASARGRKTEGRSRSGAAAEKRPSEVKAAGLQAELRHSGQQDASVRRSARATKPSLRLSHEFLTSPKKNQKNTRGAVPEARAVSRARAETVESEAPRENTEERESVVSEVEAPVPDRVEPAVPAEVEEQAVKSPGPKRGSRAKPAKKSEGPAKAKQEKSVEIEPESNLPQQKAAAASGRSRPKRETKSEKPKEAEEIIPMASAPALKVKPPPRGSRQPTISPPARSGTDAKPEEQVAPHEVAEAALTDKSRRASPKKSRKNEETPPKETSTEEVNNESAVVVKDTELPPRASKRSSRALPLKDEPPKSRPEEKSASPPRQRTPRKQAAAKPEPVSNPRGRGSRISKPEAATARAEEVVPEGHDEEAPSSSRRTAARKRGSNAVPEEKKASENKTPSEKAAPSAPVAKGSKRVSARSNANNTDASEAKRARPARGMDPANKQPEPEKPTTPRSNRKRKTESDVGVAALPLSAAKRQSLQARRLSSVSSTDSLGSTASSEGGRRKAKPVVMFTGYDDSGAKKIVSDLAGSMSDDVKNSTVLVTDKVRRTAKFLCMVAKGLPIVSPNWLVSSKETNAFQDPWLHIIKDEEAEKKWAFSLARTLRAAAKSPLLAGYKVHATKSVVPPPDQLKEIVECAGGEWLKSLPRNVSPASKTLVVSCAEDRKLFSGHKVVPLDKEVLLTGLLRHELDLKSNVLKG